MGKQLQISQDEIQSAFTKLGSSVKHTELYLRRLQKTFDILQEHYETSNVLLQAKNGIVEYLKHKNTTTTLLSQNLLKYKNSVIQEVLLLKQLRDHLNYPCNFDLKVQQPTFYQQLDRDQTLNQDAIYEIFASFDFYKELSRYELRQLLNNQLQNSFTIQFLLQDNNLLLEFWGKLLKIPSMNQFKFISKLNLSSFNKLLNQEPLLQKDFFIKKEMSKRFDNFLYKIPPLGQLVYQRKQFKAQSKNALRTQILQSFEDKEIFLQLQKDDLDQQIYILQKELNLQEDEINYSAEILRDRPEKKLQYMNRLKQVIEIQKKIKQLENDKIQIQSQIRLQQYTSSKLLLDLAIQFRNNATQLFSLYKQFQLLTGCTYDMKFTLKAVFQPLLDEFTDVFFCSVMDASQYPFQNIAEYKQLFQQNKARIIFSYQLQDLKFVSFPELFWYNICKQTQQQTASELTAQELVDLTEQEPSRLASFKQIIEKALKNKAKICKIPIISNQLELFQKQEESDEIELQLPQNAQFDEPSSEHSSDIEEVGAREVNIQTDIYVQEEIEKRDLKAKPRENSVFSDLKEELERSKSQIQPKNAIWTQQEMDQATAKYNEYIDYLDTQQGKEKLTQIFEDKYGKKTLLQSQFIQKGAAFRRNGLLDTKPLESTILGKRQQITQIKNEDNSQQAVADKNKFKNIQVEYELNDQTMTPLQRVQKHKEILNQIKVEKKSNVNPNSISIFIQDKKEDLSEKEILKQKLSVMEPDEKSSRQIMSLGYLISKKVEELSQSRSLQEHSKLLQQKQEQEQREILEKRLKETEELKKQAEEIKKREIEKLEKLKIEAKMKQIQTQIQIQEKGVEKVEEEIEEESEENGNKMEIKQQLESKIKFVKEEKDLQYNNQQSDVKQNTPQIKVEIAQSTNTLRQQELEAPKTQTEKQETKPLLEQVKQVQLTQTQPQEVSEGQKQKLAKIQERQLTPVQNKEMRKSDLNFVNQLPQVLGKIQSKPLQESIQEVKPLEKPTPQLNKNQIESQAFEEIQQEYKINSKQEETEYEQEEQEDEEEYEEMEENQEKSVIQNVLSPKTKQLDKKWYEESEVDLEDPEEEDYEEREQQVSHEQDELGEENEEQEEEPDMNDID